MDSVAERQRLEREKAQEKYGTEGLQPAGHPDYDILDFAINEVVGLARYAEMIQNRFVADGEIATCLPPDLLTRIQRVTSRLTSVALREGEDLISIRDRLLDLGLPLGQTEEAVRG